METFKLQNSSKNVSREHVVEAPSGRKKIANIIDLARAFYRRYVKPYSRLHSVLVNLIKRNHSYCYIQITIFIDYISRRNECRWRQLKPLQKAVLNNGWPQLELRQPEPVVAAMPLVAAEKDEVLFERSSEQHDFPRLYVAQASQAQVFGSSNMVVVGDDIICHDLFRARYDYTSEELTWNTVAIIDSNSARARWLQRDKQPLYVEKAAVFLDACASNYAHWLSEVLPRVALFCSQPQFDDVPIVVDARLHKNIMDSLLAVTGDARDIIALPASRSMVVNTLYITSVAGYVPFDQRGDNTAEHSHGLFSHYSQRCMLERLSHQKQLTGQHAKSIDWPEKVYLRRTSGVRKLINNDALEAALETHGFVAVEPEALTFDQQVMLFQNARVIVSPTGAALANAMFCRPGAKVVVMMGRHKKMIYKYWLNMLSFLDVHVCYLLGTIDAGSGLGIHGDFKVDIDDFHCLMNKLNRL